MIARSFLANAAYAAAAAAATRLIWVFDRPTRTFAIYTTADGPPAAVRGAGETVDGGDVLPGFTLDVAAVFAEAGPPSSPSSAG